MNSDSKNTSNILDSELGLTCESVKSGLSKAKECCFQVNSDS